MYADQFISAATNIGRDSSDRRKELVVLFDNIEKGVKCEHCTADAYYQADYILRNQHIDGPVVEFGAYAGGMACKLSHVAEMVNKKYVIFDSFTGLPKDVEYEPYDKNMKFLGQFKKNQFSCSINELHNNLQKYGMFFLCEFVDGLIEDTLPHKDIKPSHVFIDVDIVETAKFIIENIYDKLTCGTLFTHEACLTTYMDALMDENWWKDVMKKPKPIFGHETQGNPYGLINSGCLNFLTKHGSDQDFLKLVKEVKT